MHSRIRTHSRCLLFACLAIAVCATGCDLLDPDDPVDLDFRGEWSLIAQHQKEPELNIRYAFTLTENVDHAITATARQYLIDLPLWENSVDVSGRVEFGSGTLRLEFDYPDSGLDPEVVLATYSRVRTELSVVTIAGEHYSGNAVGLLLPRDGLLPYETDVLTIEQIQ